MKTNPLIDRIVLGIGILLIAAFSALPLIPPRAVSADAPAAYFSAERAMTDLAVIAKEPHASGSRAQSLVRQYIVEQVKAIGLDAQIDTSGAVSNILVRIPGTNSTGIVLVTGHYDSHSPAPGAGDNGISVAAMLEAIRVVKASQPLPNDVLFLFTDGEESGWTGASAFSRQYSGEKQNIIMLCFDARPGNAPLLLQETTPDDDWLVRQMVGLPVSAWAASWKRDQERNEMDYDFDILKASGFTGVVFENEASGTRYHTTHDTVDAISPNLMQAYGKTMLALARRFGSIDLRTRTSNPDLAYITLPLIGLVAYPNWLMFIFSGIAVLFLFASVFIGWQRKQLSVGRFLLGLLGLLVGTLFLIGLAQIAWKAILEKYAVDTFDHIGFESSAKWLSILMISSIFLMFVFLSLLSRRLGRINIAVAAPVIFLILGFVYYLGGTIGNPLGIGWIAWSFIGYVASLVILLFTKKRVWKVILLLCSAFPILTVTGPYIILATFTREETWLPILVVSAWAALFAPHMDSIFGYNISQASTDAEDNATDIFKRSLASNERWNVRITK